MGASNAGFPLKILLVVDDSAHSAAAVGLISRITWPVGALVHVLAVVPERLPIMDPNLETPRETNEALELLRWRDWAAAKIVATEAGDQLKARKLKVQTDVCEGPVSQVVVDQAVRLEANLVVIGARGLCPAGQFRLSPVTHKLTCQADYSLLVARPSEQVRPLNTLIAVDDSPEAWRAVEFLGALSLPQWARVTIVAIPTKGAAGRKGSVPAMSESLLSAADMCINRAIERLHHFGVQVRSVMQPGSTVEAILTTAQEQATDLIVVGAKTRPDNLAQKVIKYAPCSVLAVRKTPHLRLIPVNDHTVLVPA